MAKTNNAVEAWHRGFSVLCGQNHPTVYSFIDKLLTEQSKNELIIEQLIAGAQPPPAKKVYRDTARHVKTIVEDYANRDLVHFLRGISHNFEFQAHS